MTRRKSIRLSPDEVALLKKRYLLYRIPSDQYKRRLRIAARFLREWNALSGRSDCWEDVIHFIITKRKNGEWVTFGDTHLLMAEPDWDTLTAPEWASLERAYREVVLAREVASDHLVYDQTLAAELARRFAALTGRSLPSMTLAALAMSKRKRGEWVRLTPADGLGFSDIDEVA